MVIYLMNLKEYCCEDDDFCTCILGPFILETNWDKLLELLESIFDGEGSVFKLLETFSFLVTGFGISFNRYFDIFTIIFCVGSLLSGDKDLFYYKSWIFSSKLSIYLIF